MGDSAILTLMPVIVAKMDRLSTEDRITLLLGLLAQEICTLPPSDRGYELERVLDELPGILRVTEDAMREILVQNAREEPPPHG